MSDPSALAEAGLILVVLLFATLHEYKRREAARLRRELTILIARDGDIRRQAREDGVIEGYKKGWGETYVAALKATRAGRDPVAAIVRAGRMNAPALLEPTNGETMEVS